MDGRGLKRKAQAEARTARLLARATTKPPTLLAAATNTAPTCTTALKRVVELRAQHTTLRREVETELSAMLERLHQTTASLQDAWKQLKTAQWRVQVLLPPFTGTKFRVVEHQPHTGDTTDEDE